MTLLHLPKLCDLTPVSPFSHRGEGNICRIFSEEGMRHVYSNKDTSVLSQGADAYTNESPFILAGATVLRTGGDRREAAGPW